MKQLFPKKLTPGTIWLSSYILLMIALWFLPKQFNTGWITFLHLPMNRFLLLLTTSALAWLVYEHILTKHQPSESKLHPELTKELQALFSDLRRTKIPDTYTKGKSLYQIPWLLALGTQESGKSDIYETCAFKRFQIKNFPTSSEKHFIACYVGHDAVIFDINIPIVNQEDRINTASICETFLQECRQSRRAGLNGVMINLSMQQLTSIPSHQLTHLLSWHKKTLDKINQTLRKPIPAFITINHMDSLGGFGAFFGHLDASQRDLPWGLELSQFQFSNINQLCERFDQQFDLLVQKLHNQLINKLHQEPQHSTRCSIKEFPLQMDAIKRPLARILQYISDCFISKHDLQLQGFYFTASGKITERIDRLLPAINKTFSLIPVEKTSIPQPNAYFIRGMFYHIILPALCEQQQSIRWIYYHPNFRYISSLGLASALIVTCTFLWTRQLSSSLESIDTVQHNLNEYLYQTKNDTISLHQTLANLNDLYAVMTTLSQYKTPSLSIPMLKQQNLIDLATTAYQAAVGRFIYSYLTKTLEQLLTNKTKPDAAQIYTGLKFYLQFIKQQPINPADFEQWLMTNNPIFAIDLNDSLALKQHITLFLSQKMPNIKLDLALIQGAREQLINLPRHELAMTIILEELVKKIPHREIPIAPINQVIPILMKKNNIIISSIYTKDGFKETCETLIPQAAKIASQGNAVTGKIPVDESLYTQEFIQRITDLYFQQYTQTWKNILDDLQIVPFNSYQHAIQIMDNFTKLNSPLYELLQIANYHTDVRYNDISTPISIKFQNLHGLFNSYGENNYYAMLAQIRKLQEILAAIANTPDHEKAAFVVAKQRMEKNEEDIFDEIEAFAITLPVPLQQWLLKLNQSAWQLVLNDARHFINHEWDQQIAAFYQEHLQPCYPFDNKARKEAKLAMFNQFFSQSGIVDKFYRQYLAPFIDDQDGAFHWKTRNAASLGNKTSFLMNLHKLLNLRDIFFSHIPTEATLEFTIQPIALQPVVKASIFSIDEQQARFSHYAQLPQTFRWSNSQALHMTSLAIIGIDGRQAKVSETGLWSLFRLLQQATITPTLEKNSTIVTFDIDGYGVEFEFLNNANNNPFAQGLFSGVTLEHIA